MLLLYIGKTQFCFNCCIEAVIQHNKSVIFIDTELKFDPLRLSQLITSKLTTSHLTSMTKSVTASSSNMNPIETDSFINKQVNEMLDHIKVCILVLFMYMLRSIV